MLKGALHELKIGRTDRLKGWRSRVLAFLGVVFIRCYRFWMMLALAFGASAPAWSGRWNRA